MATKKTASSAPKKATKTATKTSAKAPAKKVAASESKPAKAAKHAPTHEEIAKLAEKKWHERGRPEGSAHVDWHAAEHELKG